MGISQNLYKKAKRIIPGGTQLLSKRPEMFAPDIWPAYYSRAKGCSIWDLDNRKYTDMSYMGIGSCILGYADPDVNKAVNNSVRIGNMSTLNAPEEVELAQLLLEIHPWAHMTRYARSGGEAMAIAIRIARAASKKDIILFCGYHGWHDWYLSANLADDKALDGHLLAGLSSLGVPRGLKGSSFPFQFNDAEGFLRLAKKCKGRIAAVVLEPIRSQYPKNEFIEAIKEVTSKWKIALIIDEITSGFRLNIGGAHLCLGIKPDIAVFAKGISNGFPMAAIIGKRGIMRSAQDTFISSTYWTDRIGPAAALATIKKLIRKNVPEYISKVGAKVKNGWKASAKKYNINIDIYGTSPLCHFSFNGVNNLVLKTLFTQYMLGNGFLATTAFYASYAHKKSDLKRYLDAVDSAFAFIAKAQNKKNLTTYLKGGICHKRFKRLA